MICGDHICINKAEAEQYFEDNLSIEIKVLKDKKDSVDLVELNLTNNNDKKSIFMSDKAQLKKNLRTLSKEEISKKKTKLKIRQIIEKQKFKKNKKIEKNLAKQKSNKNIAIQVAKKTPKYVNKPPKITSDICTILVKCSIDEISKYLIDKAKKDKFPDITSRELK